MSSSGVDAVARLAKHNPHRTEAELQADIYLLLTAGGLHLPADEVVSLEVQTGDGTRRRIDVEVGHCVIEVNKDLRASGIRRDAEVQLGGYVDVQGTKTNSRYVGILTDGTTWALYNEMDGKLVRVTELTISGGQDHDKLISWLEAILATRESIPPTPEEIEQRLGADSPAHLLDHATVKSLWEVGRSNPQVALKRDLWAKLLRTAFGKAFTDDDDLFVDHTLLVLTAETIAHAIIGYDVSAAGNVAPAAIARGTEFSSAQIHGAVEADFFDWVIEVPGGEQFVRSLADRISRFVWDDVEHDVLKILYESVITAQTRSSLGEYYTPDWLAEKMVTETVTDPLSQIVLDPACGSGTFVFHAVRHYLEAADAAGVPNGEALNSLIARVVGMDVHPVAVTLARVTYLLAIGTNRLAAPDRGALSIPVYLGDSLQWEQNRSMLSAHEQVVITTTGDDLVHGGGLLFGDDLVFPASVLNDASAFDRLIVAMADKAADTTDKESSELIEPIIDQFGIDPRDGPVIATTFDTMRRLHATGRDHIWGYYVRNLIRPIWLSHADHKVDVLIGNPPWLRYSKMTKPMQDRYKAMCKALGLLSGPLGASGRDLSTLFVARTCDLYLKVGGRFAFVMPHGTLTRKPHEGFRSGRWLSADGGLNVAFGKSWDLLDCSTGFPMVSCVVHGTLPTSGRTAMPAAVEAWSLRLKNPNVRWAVAGPKLTISEKTLSVLDIDDPDMSSWYKKRFRDGAILYPRVLVMVEQDDPGPLGAGIGRMAVRSRRSTQEKEPWKSVPSRRAILERAFVRSVHLGETIVPYRALEPLLAVIPATETKILSERQIAGHPGLEAWWERAEADWAAHKSPTDDSTLLDRIDYFGQLSRQLPAISSRVVYTASGNTLAAARITDPLALIEHKLYWAAFMNVDEAKYLCAILNSQTVLDRVTPLQALGLFGPRDFDKNVFAVPLPVYDRKNPNHQKLASLAGEAETVAAAIDFAATDSFKTKRKIVRAALAKGGLAAQIEAAVDSVVPPLG